MCQEPDRLLRDYAGRYPSYFMTENGIPRRGSDDVLAVWSGKGAKSH
jgi:hypothetical protein